MIKLGLYGCGNRTKSLIDTLKYDEFYKVHAAYDLNESAAKALTEKYGGTVCHSADELAAFDGVDAYLISLAPIAHADALRKMIPAGKPIFIEKPVSFSGAEMKELALLAEKYNVPVQVGFMRRYLPETLAALDYIKTNETGQVFSVECNWLHHGETEMNYHVFNNTNDFRLKVSQIPFHCCHQLDVMLLMGGKVKRVTSHMNKIIDRPYPSPDDLTATVEFESGAIGRFHYSSMVYYSDISYRFHAENYSMQMNTRGKQMIEIYKRPRFVTSRLGKEPEKAADCGQFNITYESFCKPDTMEFSQGLAFANENIMYDFVRTVRDGKPPWADLWAAARVQGFAEAIELSAKLGRTIEFDEDGLPVIA